MDLLVFTCHQRGALATGGMAALLLPPDKENASCRTVLATVTRQSHWSNEHACRSATLFYCDFDYHSDSVSCHLSSIFFVKSFVLEAGYAVLSYVSMCFRFLHVCLYTFQIEVTGDRCWCWRLHGVRPWPHRTNAESTFLVVIIECELPFNVFWEPHSLILMTLFLFLSATQLFQLHTHGVNQLHQLREDLVVTPDDLLSMPAVSRQFICQPHLSTNSSYLSQTQCIRI